MERELLEQDKIFLIHDFLSPEECQQYIDLSESEGYGEAPITTAQGFVMRKDIRNNERVILDDVEMADKLYQRAKEFLPEVWYNTQLVGFNERFRFYRYDVGQMFARHMDGYYERDNGDRSQLTFMIYLNDDYEGGATTFEKSKDLITGKAPLKVVPKTGLALVFYHHQIHEGTTITRGRKYVLRTDVMYRKDYSLMQ